LNSIFIKTALIFQQVLIVSIISTFDFTKSSLRDFIANSLGLIHWIIVLGGKAVVLSQTATKARKQFLSLKAINSAMKDFRK